MFDEDLDVFLADFGVDATFTPTSGSGSTPRVIFDRAYFEQLGVAGTNPIAMGKASDFAEATSIGGTLVINTVTYTIRERQPQDDGAFVLLQLST